MGKGWPKDSSRASSKKRKRSSPVHSRLALKTYAWENKWHHWSHDQFSGRISYPRHWIRWAFKKYKVPPTVVRQRAGNEQSFFRPIDWSINLIKEHHNVAASLHEAAHAIIFWYYGDTAEAHDGRWLGVYVWLLKQTGMYPASAIDGSLKAEGLSYSKMMTPAVLRRRIPAMRIK